MCQLGAVLVSTHRVFRQDGVRSHSDLRRIAEEQFPGERFFEAEFDFVERRWDWPERFDEQADPLTARAAMATMLPLLERFAVEQWGDAERLIAFVRHAGVPECALLTGEAREAYAAARAEAVKAYDAAMAEAWCVQFESPRNRIEVWACSL